MLATTGLVILSPLLLVVTLLILWQMGRPVLFLQTRLGLGGKHFQLLKFRSMRPPALTEDPLSSDEMRISRLGKFLRNSSIDELPALINVIKGEMSLVGPRPLLPQYKERYSPRQARRHEAIPGITGWAQINGRNAISWEERFELDVWYVDNRSLLLDLKILARTICKVISQKDTNHPGSATMYEFKGTRR